MKIKIFSEAEMRGSPCAGLRGCQRSSTAGLYDMHIVPETHFGFGMQGAICSRAFIIFCIFLELRGMVAVFNIL